MIRQSFQSIINPKNIIERFQSESENESILDNYNKIKADMDGECSIILDDMEITKYNITDENACIEGGRTYAKSDERYKTLREENLRNIEEDYKKINDSIEENAFEKVNKFVCLMNKLFHNVQTVTEYNNEVEKKNQEKENTSRENELLIEQNSITKKKDKNLNLVSDANVIGTKESQKKIQIQYLIFLILIAIFLVIQLVIFFV